MTINSQIDFSDVSIIIPSKNEHVGLSRLLPEIVQRYPDAEVIVVNDGSTDETISLCEKLNVRVVTHPYSKGNGAAVKTGARHAAGNTLVYMDADGQHRAEDILKLVAKLNDGYEMVVGARDKHSQASIGRRFANALYNKLSTYMTGHCIKDLTSGFRAVNAKKFKHFLHFLPNGFSYPTTITMIFFRMGYSVAYEPIFAPRRQGKSHINPIADGVRFLLIIFKVGVLYSPLKLFTPLSVAFFSVGLLYYLQTYIQYSRFTNMSALLLSISVLIFLIGLVSEQVTQLMYNQRGENADDSGE